MIGDVVGRGFVAADVMGRMRSVLRGYALLGGDPAEVLGRLDQQVQHFDPEMTATVLLAILALRRQDSGEIGPLDLVVPALPWSLRDIRFAVRRWLSAVGAAPRAVADLLVAVGEASTNAVEHAYGPSGGTVSVHLELQLPDVVATVRDTGRWRPPRGENRGRGTMFMQKCSDDLRIDHGHTGTNVVIRRRLGEEAPR